MPSHTSVFLRSPLHCARTSKTPAKVSAAEMFGDVSGAADSGIVAAVAKPTTSARRAGVVNFMMLLVEAFALDGQEGWGSKLFFESN